MFRRVPPVYSPVSGRALWAGLMAAMSPRAAERARVKLDEWVRRTYQPSQWLWTDSGTSALMLALRLAKGAGRRRVALPAYGCYDLATACDGAEVEVALYDVDPTTLGPDWGSLEGALRSGADTIVLAYLFGTPIDMRPLAALRRTYGCLIIEDAAQGTGVRIEGRVAGSFGDLSVFSFGRGKGLTGGGGGLLTAAQPFAGMDGLELSDAPASRSAKSLLVSCAQAILGRPSLYWIPASVPLLRLGETIYRPPHEPGRMLAASFGLLMEGVRGRAAAVERRRVVAASLESALPAGWRAGCPRAVPGGVPGWLRFPILAPSREQRDGALKSLCGSGAALAYPLAIADLEGFRARRQDGGATHTGAETLRDRLLTLSVHPGVEISTVLRGFSALGAGS